MGLIIPLLLLQDFSPLDATFHRPHQAKDPARYFRLTDTQALKALWTEEQAVGEVPDVDFKEWMVLAMFPGMAGDRHLLIIESLKEEKCKLVLRYSLKATGIEGGPGLLLAYAALKVRRSDLPILILECSDGKKERNVQEFGPLKPK